MINYNKTFSEMFYSIEEKRSLLSRGSLFNLFNVYLSLLELGELENSSPPQPSYPNTLPEHI